jgi:hypothetical protein
MEANKRQFIISDKPEDLFNNPQIIQFKDFYLTADNLLEVTTKSSETIQLILIGFLLSYKKPNNSNTDILEEILADSNTFNDVVSRLKHYSGRWALIYISNDEVKIINDIVGARQVYYYYSDNKVFCASQPHIVAKISNQALSIEKSILDYYQAAAFSNSECAWIGDETRYENIFHLLPNKYFNLLDGKVTRFWPLDTIKKQDLNSASSKIANILKNIMYAANCRYDLSIPISAGWDSRVLLSASKEIIHDCYCFIQKYGEMNYQHPDIYVPKKLSNTLNFNFTVHNAVNYDSEFDSAIMKSVDIAQSNDKKILCYNFYESLKGKLNISGVVGELNRSRYGKNRPVSAKGLVDYFGRSDSIYAIRQAEKWLKEIQKSDIDIEQINLWDLFYWEQYIGNWGTSFQATLDISNEELFPFNCREIVETSYGLNELPYNNSPLFIGVINELWPEVLTEPVNPLSFKGKIIKTIKKTLRKMGIFNHIKNVFYYIKK